MRGMTFAAGCFIMTLPVFFLVSSLLFTSLYAPSMDAHFRSYPEELREDGKRIVGYVTWTGSTLPGTLEPREAEHLEDVRLLMGAAWATLFVSGAGMMWAYSILRKKRGAASQAVLFGSLASLAALFVLVFASANFQSFFWSFHEIFFEPGSWVFSYDDLLIRLYPSAFFEGMFISILLNAAAMSVVALNISLLLRNRPKLNFLLQ